MRHNQGIWDAHVHTHGGCTVDGYLRNGRDNLSASGLDGMNLLCVRHGRSACITDAEALLLKALLPGRFTVYCTPAFQIEEFGSALYPGAEIFSEKQISGGRSALDGLYRKAGR